MTEQAGDKLKGASDSVTSSMQPDVITFDEYMRLLRCSEPGFAFTEPEIDIPEGW